MGNQQSPKEQAEQAEKDILDWGLEWWTNRRKKRRFQNFQPLAADGSLHVVMEAADTTCDDRDPTVTMHSVKYTCPNTNPDGVPLVVFGGYGSGTGIYYAVLPGLCQMSDGPVYVCDFLGCGLSTRKQWTLGFGCDANVQQVEDYFCNAMEEWRKNMGIDQMILTGHSMGGYLSVAYAERHPQSLHRLLLVSPVGLPDADPRTLERVANAPWYFRLGFSMWKSGYSPMAVPGTWWMLGFHGNNRYNDASWTTKELLRQYFYYNWCNGDPSAGARTHATLLTPGAYARNPLHARVPQLVGKVARISCIYGDKDWMGHYHFESVKKKINDAAVAAGETTMPIDVTRVADGGHNMMVDNPEGFLDAFWTIQEACKNDRENGTGMKDGQIFGQEAWMHERRIANALVKGASVEGRSKDPNGSSSQPYMWTKCEIIEANGNGTFKVRWKEGNDAGKISSNFGGHLLKLDEV